MNRKNKYIEGRVVTNKYSCKVAQCDQVLSQWAVSGENVFGLDRTLIKLCKT